MRNFFKRFWFRQWVIAAIVLPAALTQTMYPVFGFPSWESLADKVYPLLLDFEQPVTETKSKVVIVEVDQHTIDMFGWPINRMYYSQLLDKLKSKGHPYLMTMLSFQALHKSATNEDSKFRKQDEQFAQAIKNYGRVIGTSLLEKEGAELTGWQEEELMPRIALSNAQTPPEELPYLPMHFIEDDIFLDGQLALGFATRRGDATVAFCSQMYITDVGFSGTFVVPSSLTWLSAFTSGRGFKTATGAAWPRKEEDAPVDKTNPFDVGFRHCVSSPQLLTDDFFDMRQIEVISMADILDDSYAGDFSGKAIILGSDSSSGFPGPGQPKPENATRLQDNKVKEYQFAARLVDDMITGKSIRRENLARNQIFSQAPLFAAALLIFISFLGLTRPLLLTATTILVGSLAWSYIQLTQGEFLIPVQLIVFLSTVTAFIVVLEIQLRFYGISRQIRFSGKIRAELAQCNTIFEMEQVTQELCKSEFYSCRLKFEDFDRGLYKAAANPKAALQYIDKNNLILTTASELREDTNIRRVPNKRGIKGVLYQEKGCRANLSISSKETFLGTAKISMIYLAHEQRFIKNLLDSLQQELSQHWNRIKMLADQKILDYRVLMEQTRSDILSRFLTHTLVSKFSNKMTMEENLGIVLTPRPTKAALMQADIRGYSKISAKLAPKDMVQLLQNYYKNVVDAAQLVAQVKLIGDCIFLFIEESAALPDLSPVDMCAELASILVNETNEQNLLRQAKNEEPMFFGVAIHYGDVVVGNLSSDSCIDYTVIGPNVNMVARLEEMTKHPSIAEKIGHNGTILSVEAINAMKKHNLQKSAKLNLVELNASVRSFSMVTDVIGVTSEEILSIKPTLFAGIAQANKLQRVS